MASRRLRLSRCQPGAGESNRCDLDLRDTAYEPATQDALARLLHSGDIAFDIGANVGHLTVAMAGLVGPTGWVYAFEANPQCLPLLQATLRANGACNCTVVRGAVGAQHGGTRVLYSDERPGMQWVTSSLDPTWKLPDSGATRPLEITALSRPLVNGASIAAAGPRGIKLAKSHQLSGGRSE